MISDFCGLETCIFGPSTASSVKSYRHYAFSNFELLIVNTLIKTHLGFNVNGTIS